MLKYFYVILILLFLNACSTATIKQDTTPEPIEHIPQQPVEIIEPPMETQVFYTKPVVKKLLKKARLKYQEKNYHAAVSLLERAIDISPNNPFVWQQLAMVRLKQQNYAQAEQLAAKSNVLGESNDELRMKNWQIIAEAKRGRKGER